MLRGPALTIATAAVAGLSIPGSVARAQGSQPLSCEQALASAEAHVGKQVTCVGTPAASERLRERPGDVRSRMLGSRTLFVGRRTDGAPPDTTLLFATDSEGSVDRTSKVTGTIAGRVRVGDSGRDVVLLANASFQPSPNSFVVIGTLVDLYTGRPLAERRVTWHWTRHSDRDPRTITDSAGRFRFELADTPREWVRPYLEITGFPGVDRTRLSTANPSPIVAAEEAFREGDVTLWNETIYAGAWGAGLIDKGVLRFADDSLADAAFADVCDGGSTTTQPATDVLVFMKGSGSSQPWAHSLAGWAQMNSGWELPARGRNTRSYVNAQGWSPPWKAIVCIETDSDVVGNYVPQRGVRIEGSGQARSVTWRVKVVRLSDRRTFGKTFKSQPPQYGDVDRGAMAGDPWEELQRWVRTLR